MSKNDSSERKEADKGIREMQFRPADTHTDRNSIGGEGLFKQTGALMPHCLSEDSYLLLGSSPAFPAFRWGCCCLLRKKNSANLKKTKKQQQHKNHGGCMAMHFFCSVQLTQRNLEGWCKKTTTTKNWCYKQSYLQGVLPLSACRWQ